MKILSLLFFLLSLLLTGCAYLPLTTEPRAEDNIDITWEETDGEHLVVTYHHSKTGSSNSPEEAKVAPLKIEFDTLVTDTLVAGTGYEALFAEINSWMGTPYGYGRHEKNKGTDCSGFTMEIYQRVYNITLNRSSDAQVANTTKVKKEDLQIGDLVFFNIRGNRISHVGLYIGNNKIVHSTVKSGVIISDLDEKYYKQHYSGSGRVIKNP